MNAILKDLPQEPLSAEREQELTVVGDTETVVLHALRGAVGYMRRISHGRIPDDELLSSAYSALVEAVKTFKPGRGRFSSYARPHLRGRGGLAGIWNAKDTVRGAAKHEQLLEKDKRPEPLESDSVEPAWGVIEMRERWEKIQPLISKVLSALEIRVLDFRFKQCLTLQETGLRIGKSRERIRQIEKAALLKLRAAAAEYRKAYL